MAVYFGHPSTFWKQRQRLLLEASVDVEDMKKQGDLVYYDAVHMQRSIINRTCDKVRDVLNKEELQLNERRMQLKELLQKEEEEFIRELVTKQELEECGVCKERTAKHQKYLEEIEREKVRECQRALEREKIAKGMQCQRIDDMHLKEMQKMQMDEKRCKDLEEDMDRMWHQVLIDDVKRKEHMEVMEYNKRQREMIERRRTYDEQIASANRRRDEAIKKERDKENIRINISLKRMEEEHLEAMQKKKEQQMKNKQTYLEGHRMKMSRLQDEKYAERRLDDNTIRIALNGLENERRQQRTTMNKLQTEKKIFLEYYDRERDINDKLERDREYFEEEWRRSKDNTTEEQLKYMEAEKRNQKEAMADEYNKHLEERKMNRERTRINRIATKEKVRGAAVRELQRQLGNANEELRKQVEYRKNLRHQIENNRKTSWKEEALIENQLKPFTDKVETFREAMMTLDQSPGRRSTNPVHPFARVMAKQTNQNIARLPCISVKNTLYQ